MAKAGLQLETGSHKLKVSAFIERADLDIPEFSINLRIEGTKICDGRYHASLQSHYGLDQSCNTTPSFKVSNITFNGTSTMSLSVCDRTT